MSYIRQNIIRQFLPMINSPKISPANIFRYTVLLLGPGHIQPSTTTNGAIYKWGKYNSAQPARNVWMEKMHIQ